jgi:hypothetical protein
VGSVVHEGVLENEEHSCDEFFFDDGKFGVVELLGFVELFPVLFFEVED